MRLHITSFYIKMQNNNLGHEGFHHNLNFEGLHDHPNIHCIFRPTYLLITSWLDPSKGRVTCYIKRLKTIVCQNKFSKINALDMRNLFMPHSNSLSLKTRFDGEKNNNFTVLIKLKIYNF